MDRETAVLQGSSTGLQGRIEEEDFSYFQEEAEEEEEHVEEYPPVFRQLSFALRQPSPGTLRKKE